MNYHRSYKTFESHNTEKGNANLFTTLEYNTNFLG